MIGFLNVRKPPGPTSHDIVAAVRRKLPRGVKVGHCGTLDPFAEGVLVVCVGAATRLATYVQQQPKRYLAQFTLGAGSTTDDPMGTITPAPGPAAAPSEADVRAAAAKFVGEISQRPPDHSAVHVEGQRAYKLARRGQDMEIPERTVTVYAIEVVRYEYPELEVDIRCGGGTYVRALARDIGEALGTAGYCSRLVRSEVGEFRLDSAAEPDDLSPAKDLIPPILALGEMPRISLSDSDCARIRMGQSVTIPQSNADSPIAHRKPSVGVVITQSPAHSSPQSSAQSSPQSSAQCAILDPLGNLIVIAERECESGTLRPRIVLSNP